jgi:hypothetical protein
MIKMMHNSKILAALVSVVLLAGCGREEAKQIKAEDPVVQRMADKEYVKKLDASVKAQRDLAKEAAKIEAKIQKAIAEGKSAEYLLGLTNELKKCYHSMNVKRVEAQMLVRDKMLSGENKNLKGN